MQPWPRRGTQPRMSCVRARRDCRRSHAQSTRLLEPGIELRTLAQGAALPRHRVRPPGSIPCTVTSPRRTGSSVACASSASLSGSTMARSLPPAEDDALPPSARSVRSWRANPLPGMTRMQPLCSSAFVSASENVAVSVGAALLLGQYCMSWCQGNTAERPLRGWWGRNCHYWYCNSRRPWPQAPAT